MATYKNDPREMTARYPGVCAESGKPIKKGDTIIYYPSGKKTYLVGSAPKAEAGFRESVAAMAAEDGTWFC